MPKERRGVARPAAALAPKAAVAALSGLAAWHGLGNALAWARGAPDAPYVDFNVLLLAGRLARQGRLGEAYSWPAMAALERADSLREGYFMPFSYPPPLALAMAGLSGLPAWVAYALFVGAGVTLFASALRAMAGPLFWPVAAALAPAAYLNVGAGQNGLLFAGLTGWATVLLLRGRSTGSGALAGLVGACKPQVALGLPLLFILRRDGRALLAAAAVGVGLIGLSTAAFGSDAVRQFLAGLSETGRALATGHYPLHRMASAFACLLALGAPALVALALHAAIACAAFGVAAASARRGDEPRAVAGLALAASGFASPYLYDYDLCVPGLGLALLAPALAQPDHPLRLAVPLFAFGAAGAVGFAQGGDAHPLSLGGPLLLLGLVSIVSTLSGARRIARNPAGAPA